MDENKFVSKWASRLLAHPGVDDLLSMSTHVDGFKREDAVRRLGKLADPRAIPYLIVRANDWVPQVRAAAYQALIRMLETGNGPAFVAALPQIVHLESCRRDDHSGLLRAIQGFLLREQNRAVLLSGMDSSDSRIARIVVRLLMDHQLLKPAQLVRRCLAHTDVVVRSSIVHLLEKLSPEEFDEVVCDALRDGYMPVRREAFQQLLRRAPDQGLAAARRLLFDRSASIREIAVRRLLAAGDSVDQLYAHALTQQHHTAAMVRCVLWGWAMTSARARIDQTKQFLASPLASVRRAALVAIVQLSQAEVPPVLERFLSDPSPAVCNEAARLMKRINYSPSIDTLISIAKGSGRAPMAMTCCRVAREGDKWDWLRFILSVYGQAACEISEETLQAEIDEWNRKFNRTHAQPHRALVEEIGGLLSKCRYRLSSDRVRLLEFTLGRYTR